MAYSLKYKIDLLLFAKSKQLFYSKCRVKPCFHSIILLVTDKIFVHKNCSDKICFPSKPVNRHLFGYYLLFIDQMKRFGRRQDKCFSGNVVQEKRLLKRLWTSECSTESGYFLEYLSYKTYLLDSNSNFLLRSDMGLK